MCGLLSVVYHDLGKSVDFIFARSRLGTMKLLAVIPTPFITNRGSSLRARNQISQLIEGDCTVDVITYPLGNDPLLQKGISLHRAPISFGYKYIPTGPSLIKILFDIQMLVMVIIRLMRTRYEILYAYNYEGIIIADIARKLIFWKRLLIVADIQGAFTQEMELLGGIRGPRIKKLFTAFENYLYRCPVAISVSSPELKAIIQARYPTKDVVVIGDEVAQPMSSLTPDKEYSMQEITIVYTGGFTPDKGVELLLNAFSDPYFTTRPIKLILAGGPVSRVHPLVRNHVHRNQISVVDLSENESLDEVLAQADILCDPKYKNTGQSSGKLVRYITYGVPIIACDTIANRYYLGDAYPYVAQPQSDNDSASLVWGIQQLIDDPQQYQSVRTMVSEQLSQLKERSVSNPLIQIIKNQIQ